MNTRAATRTTEPVSADDQSEAKSTTWRAHPAAQRPAQAFLAVGIILVVAGFVFVTTESIGLAVLGIVVLTAALNRFFFPSRFTIDDEGITAAYPLRRMHHTWSELHRFVWDEHGGYLSTRAIPSRLDAYRGMHLLFDDAQRAKIIESIQQKMKHARASA